MTPPLREPANPRLGVKLPSSGPDAGAVPVDEAATAAEEAGFDSVWVSDHVVMPSRMESRYPYSRDGSVSWAPDGAWYEALVAMAVAAAVTARVEVGVGVLIAPMREPILLAKQVATLDALSGGRVALGVGAGWLEEEFVALGAPFATRGERLDEWIDIMRDCWTGTPRGGAYRHHHVPEGLFCYPVPEHDIPIIIGGMTAAARRRAAVRGDGWFALEHADEVDVDGLRAAVADIDEQARAAGRPPPPRMVIRIPGSALAVARRVTPLAEAGITDLVVDVDWADPADPRRTVEIIGGAMP